MRKRPERKAYYVLREKERVAQNTNVKFDLDIDWHLKKVNNGYCEVTGFALNTSPEDPQANNPFQPEIDRIIPGSDYTKANCRIVCRIFNAARSNYPDSIFLEMCRRVLQHGLGIKN